MTWTSSTVRDAMVQIDKQPQWVRVSAVEAISPTHTGKSTIYLAGGQTIITETLVEDIIEKMTAAMRPPGPVTVPS